MEGLQLRYFVLSPEKQGEYGQASRDAMVAYAATIRPINPELADDLIFWVGRVMRSRRPRAAWALGLQNGG